MAEKSATQNAIGYGMCNPVTRKMQKKVEQARQKGMITETATYTGVVKKSLFFLCMVVVGIVIYFVTDSYFASRASEFGGFIEFDDGTSVFSSQITLPVLLIFVVCALITFFLPLIAWLIQPTIPVFGTLYAICEGYTAACIAGLLSPTYKWIPIVAMLLTIALVLTMTLLYTNNIIRVTGTVRKVIAIAFFTSIVGGLLIFVLSFVPVIGPAIRAISEFMNTPVIAIIGSIIYIILGALFLLVDFDTIEKCVEEKMPKKYEWMAAFGLIYTVIYIYFKILNLIIQIAQATNSNSK